MLPRENRLLAKRDFERIKKEGQKFPGRFLAVLVAQTENASPRFGLIISTKVSKKATKRNRAKRLLREAVRKILPQIKPGFDFLLLGKKEILGKSLAEVQLEVNLIFKKANVFLRENEK